MQARTLEFFTFVYVWSKAASDGGWQPLHRFYSASPHSHDGASHGVTHGQRKYHHPCIVIPGPCSFAKAACGIGVFRSACPHITSREKASRRTCHWLVTYRMYLMALFSCHWHIAQAGHQPEKAHPLKYAFSE